MPVPIVTLDPVSFKGSLLSLSGTVYHNGDTEAQYELYVDPKPYGTPYGPIPVSIVDGKFSQTLTLARGDWIIRVMTIPTDEEPFATTAPIVVSTIASRVVMPGPPDNRVIPSPPAKGANFTEPESMGEYRSMISAATDGTKRMAAAQVVKARMGTQYQLRIYQNNRLISYAEYTGIMSIEEDGTNVFVLPNTQLHGAVIESGDLTGGSWSFELQGGPNYANVLQGTVGLTDVYDIMLSHNPIAGEELTTMFKFVVPRSIDGLI